MKVTTCGVERPPVPENSFSKIPFGPDIRRLKSGTVKVLAAVARSSWVEQDTRRRVSLATNRRLAELAELADPETIGRHLRDLAEAGVVTIDDHEGRRRLTLPEVQPGEFVVLDNADQAWTLNPVPFVVLLAVRSFDWTNRGQSWPTDATLARSLGWTVRSVKRAMGELRRAGAVVTSSRYDPVRRSRKRVVTIAGKVVLLCDADHSRKSGPHLSGKVVPTHPEKWSSPTRKSGPLNQRFEIERELKPEPPPKAKFSGQSERAETAEVVVVDVKTSTDTDPEPKPGAGAEAPPMAEVAALLAESQLARDEQERYLAVTRKMTEAPPMAWHRHVLNVQPTRGTKSLAGVVISRLKAWMTTSPEQRAAIVDEITARDAEVVAERLRRAKLWYESQLRELPYDRRMTTAAEVRRSWQEYNAALKAAGQPPVVLPNEVLHAEQRERARAAVMAEHAAKFVQAAALTPPEPTPAALAEARKKTHGGDRKSQESKCKNYTPISTAEEVEAEQRERSRMFEERFRIEREQSEERNRRLAAWTSRRTAELIPAMRSDPVGLRQRLAAERAIEAERIESEVVAEFAPKFAALKPPPLAVAFASATA